MKLYAESLQSKIEDLEKLITDLKTKNSQANSNSSLNKQLRPSSSKSKSENFDAEINNYKNEISHLNQLVKKYEEHNLKIPDLEKKIKMQKLKHEKELKDIEVYYKEKIKKYEEKIKTLASNTTRNTSNNTLNTLHSNTAGQNHYFEYETNMREKNNKYIAEHQNEYATHRAVASNPIALNNLNKINIVKNNNNNKSKLNSNSKTIDDGEIDRVNVNGFS